MSPGLVRHTKDCAYSNVYRMSRMFDTIQSRLGIPEDKKKMMDESEFPDFKTIETDAIFSSIRGAAKASAAMQNAEFRKNAVGGDGPCADKLREVYGRFAGPEAFSADVNLNGNRAEIVKNMINKMFCQDCKKFADGIGDKTKFARDINRDLNVKLPDGTKLENNFEKARDQLASFTTNGAKSKYADLSDAEKAKTNVVMALLSQSTGFASRGGGMIAVDPNGRTPPFAPLYDGNAEWHFEISFDKNGSFIVRFESVSNIKGLFINDETGKSTQFDAKPGSNERSGFELQLWPNEFARLAGLDFSKYDDSVPNKFIDDKSIKNPYHKLNRHLGANFNFNADRLKMTAFHKITVNG